MFDQEQIAEFKEAFNLIDYDHDGFISKNDLEETYNSLGTCFVSLVCVRVRVCAREWGNCAHACTRARVNVRACVCVCARVRLLVAALTTFPMRLCVRSPF